MMIHIDRAESIPTGEHWAIIESNMIIGDERSCTERYLTYHVFTDKAEFEKEFRKRLDSKIRNHVSPNTIRGIHILETYGGVFRVDCVKQYASIEG